MRAAALCVSLLVAAASAQGPGDGVSKTTVASSWPWPGMAFVQRYFPTTCAQDSGSGNVQNGYTFQGRSQLTKAAQFPSGRNCQLFSAASATAASTTTSMKAPASYGADCVYTQRSTFAAAATPTYAVYAHTADQCCKACQAASVVAGGSCVAAVFTAAATVEAMLQGTVGMPQQYEGFGLHLVDVSTSKTTGGLNISEVEARFTARLDGASANGGAYDAFMDYNVVLFAGDDLPTYTAALTKDKVSFLHGTWSAHDGGAWHSVLVHVPHSQMVLELVSMTAPDAASLLLATAGPVALEARLSPRQVTRFASAGKAGGVLQAVAVTRACSNMTTVDAFYQDAVQATVEHKVDTKAGLSRRCYGWSGADSDVCFVHRPPGTVGTTGLAAEAFTVFDLESTLWAGHKAMIGTIGGVSTDTDRYNDNHYAVDLPGFSGDTMSAWLKAHESEAFPINFPTTSFAWDCMQEYLIDPTGWSVQTDIRYSSGLPGCGYAAAEKAKKNLR